MGYSVDRPQVKRFSREMPSTNSLIISQPSPAGLIHGQHACRYPRSTCRVGPIYSRIVDLLTRSILVALQKTAVIHKWKIQVVV